MARILITSWGSYGDVYPYIGLALALRERGHRPVVVMAEFYRPLVESLGFEFHPAGPAIDPDDRALIARVMDPVRGSDVLLKEILMRSLREDHAALDAAAAGADLLVTHPITFAAPVVAQARGLPWVSTVLAPMSFFSASDIPVVPPAPFLAPLARLGPWYGRAMARFARRSTRGWMKPVFDLRDELGLPPGAHPLFEGQFSPALTLALFSHVLAAPQADWPGNVSVTGFVFYNGPGVLSPELDAFLDGGPPPVVFTLGTSAVAAAGRFYEESVDAVRRLGIRAVLLTGGFEQNRPRAALPRGVLLVDRAPHQLLFPRAAAVVHQGGAGTLAQALRAGRPMLVVPHAHDQPDNAARVTRLGVARTIRPRAYRGRRVARELERLLGDRSIGTRASDVAALVRAEGGAGAAAAAIDEQIH
ncbi:MAG TPA: glycosyltransferase [Vicinamibacterales bacterium]|nr:glycosyltransferase [Vicinamibacterales bacterium]